MKENSVEKDMKFMVIRNSMVMPQGIKLGKTDK